VSDVLPSSSEPFHGEGPGPAPSLDLPDLITPAWAYGDGSGRGVRVAVLDSGIEADHPDVGAVTEWVDVQVDKSMPDGVRFDHEPHADLYGHGTACGGIIRQLAPHCELVSVRVLGTTLRGSARAFAHGLEWCIDNDIDIASLSMSTPNDEWAETFWDLVDRASYRNMMIVSAMNNEPKRTIPSEFAGVFSVACAPGTDRELVWCRSTGPGQWGAVGIDVQVAWLGGGQILSTGNSYATPVVAGHLARILGAHPGLTTWQAKTVLAALAVNRANPERVEATPP